MAALWETLVEPAHCNTAQGPSEEIFFFYLHTVTIQPLPKGKFIPSSYHLFNTLLLPQDSHCLLVSLSNGAKLRQP